MQFIMDQFFVTKDGLFMSWSLVAGVLAFNWIMTKIVRTFKK
jgi:hypothetical protein